MRHHICGLGAAFTRRWFLRVFEIVIKGSSRHYMYIPQFTAAVYNIRSGELTSTSSRRRGAVSGRQLPERTDFGPVVTARQTHLCPSHRTLWPSPRNVLQQRLTIFRLCSEFSRDFLKLFSLSPDYISCLSTVMDSMNNWAAICYAIL